MQGLVISSPTFTADCLIYSSAREHLKDVLDATARGRTITLARNGELSAVVPVDRLRTHLFRAVDPRIRLLSEDSRTIAMMEDRPFASEGSTVEEALEDLLLTLREYVEDWDERLKDAPNHSGTWALVQLVKLSTDEELKDWFERGGA